MKALLSILLGIMLLTSLVGIAHATTTVQPLCNPDPSDPNYSPCGANNGGNDNPKPSCNPASIHSAVLNSCCAGGVGRNSLAISGTRLDIASCN